MVLLTEVDGMSRRGDTLIYTIPETLEFLAVSSITSKSATCQQDKSSSATQPTACMALNNGQSQFERRLLNPKMEEQKHDRLLVDLIRHSGKNKLKSDRTVGVKRYN